MEPDQNAAQTPQPAQPTEPAQLEPQVEPQVQPTTPPEPTQAEPAESVEPAETTTEATELLETPPAPEIVRPAVSAAPHGVEPEEALAAGGGPRRILLVEDDDSLANVYTTRLEGEGFDVRRVANGEDALAAAINYQPNLVLLDVMMPKVSGFDVLDILRNTPETANLKIIMLTALSQDSDKERAESLGVDEYLVKSQVVIADVIERIKHHLHVNPGAA